MATDIQSDKRSVTHLLLRKNLSFPVYHTPISLAPLWIIGGNVALMRGSRKSQLQEVILGSMKNSDSQPDFEEYLQVVTINLPQKVKISE
jgi:hypothetical protein